MITITNREKNEENKMRIPQLGTNPKLFLGKAESHTQFFPDKKYIVISARVHPSEVASSYVVKSFLNYILKNRFKDSEM